jgi:hypothetical protein
VALDQQLGICLPGLCGPCCQAGVRCTQGVYLRTVGTRGAQEVAPSALAAHWNSIPTPSTTNMCVPVITCKSNWTQVLTAPPLIRATLAESAAWHQFAIVLRVCSSQIIQRSAHVGPDAHSTLTQSQMQHTRYRLASTAVDGTSRSLPFGSCIYSTFTTTLSGTLPDRSSQL